MNNNQSGDSLKDYARILIVLPGLGAGGTEHVVSGLANHWNKLGHHVTLITFESPEAKLYYKLDTGINIKNSACRLDVFPSFVLPMPCCRDSAYFVVR